MKRNILILFYVSLALLTTYTYRVVNVGWIASSKAERLYKKKKYDLAIDYYIKAIDKGVDPSAFLSSLNDAMHKSKSIQKSTLLLNLLIKRDPENIAAFNSLADFFVEVQNYREAAKVYRHILSIDPKDIEARFELALSLSRQGKYELAIEEYEILLEEDR